MFRDNELAIFAIDEFLRGLEGVTPEEALIRRPKADGTAMNAISWTTLHVADHWRNVQRVAHGAPIERRTQRDGTPPPFDEAHRLLLDARARLDLTFPTVEAYAEAMSQTLPQMGGETVGQFLARAILHTWFHTGEVNAVRQLLGHPDMHFVGDSIGTQLHWHPPHEV